MIRHDRREGISSITIRKFFGYMYPKNLFAALATSLATFWIPAFSHGWITPIFFSYLFSYLLDTSLPDTFNSLATSAKTLIRV